MLFYSYIIIYIFGKGTLLNNVKIYYISNNMFLNKLNTTLFKVKIYIVYLSYHQKHSKKRINRFVIDINFH